jgi:hypothetical protein
MDTGYNPVTQMSRHLILSLPYPTAILLLFASSLRGGCCRLKIHEVCLQTVGGSKTITPDHIAIVLPPHTGNAREPPADSGR